MKKKPLILPPGFITTIVCLLFFTAAIAQHKPFFINSTEADGLSDNHITCFYKDKTGYMWIGTENGLNRFDGREIKIYKPSGFKKNNLSNAFITSVAQDRAGHMWVGTRKGLNRIDVFTDTTEIWGEFEVKNTGLPGEAIWDVFPESDTSVWVIMDTKSFVRYNPVSRLYYYFDFIKHIKENNIGLKSKYHTLLKMVPKSANEFWLATTDGIFSFNKPTGSFKLEYGVSLDKITFFYYDISADKLYCADERKVVYVYESGTKKITMLNADAANNRSKFLLPYSAGEGGLFIPAPEGLLFVKNNEVEAFVSGEDNIANNLLSGKINTVYKDRDGITWIGTGKGVSRFVPQLNDNLHISFPKNLVFDPEFALKNFLFLPDKNEWLVASFSDNKIWKVNNHTGIISEFKKSSFYTNDTCYAFYSRHPDSIFLLCNKTMLMYSFRKSKWDKISLPDSLSKGSFTCMSMDGEGNYWLGTRRKGFLVYNPRTKTVWSPDEKVFADHIIHALQFDSMNNYMWIGTHNRGLYGFDLTNKTFLRIQRNDALPHSIHSSLVNNIALDKKNNVWAGTIEGGLAKYSIGDSPDKGVTNYETQNGLPDNNVFSVSIGENGEVYFTTAKGIGLISSDGNLKPFFSKMTGLPYSRFIQSISCLPSGKIVTTIDNNLFCFDPNTLFQSKVNPIVINKVQLDDSAEMHITNPRLRYIQNTIRFDFALIDFVSPAAIEYFYKLDGFDKDWVSNGKQRSIRYSGLQPGRYIFKVKARKANGEWSSQVAEWKFAIKPPFWKTWWFIALSTILTGYFVFYFFQDRIRKIKKREKIKREYERKIAETEMLALRAQMNPHFVFNSLNSISMLVAGQQNEKGLEYLSKFSRLLRLVLDESENNLITLRDEIRMLDLYLQLESLRFGDSFFYTFHVEEQIEDEETLIPSLLLHPIVENAVWHGLLHKQGERRLIMNFSKTEDNMLRCVVKDNGIGIEQAKLMKQERLNGTEQKSKGLQIVQDRLKMIELEYNTKTSLVMEDMQDLNGNITGTKAIITLPFIYE